MSDAKPVVLPNAYRRARRIQPGCQHNLGCKCDPPVWLRAQTVEEEALEERLRVALGKAHEEAQ